MQSLKSAGGAPLPFLQTSFVKLAMLQLRRRHRSFHSIQGEQIREGVCLNYCGMVFQECKKDYFSMDANNNVRVCREEDIICSKL
jgi:hypothetical protein